MPYLEVLAEEENSVFVTKTAIYIIGAENVITITETFKDNDKAVDINPRWAMVWHNKGVVLGKSDRHEEAKEAFEKAHEIDSSTDYESTRY